MPRLAPSALAAPTAVLAAVIGTALVPAASVAAKQRTETLRFFDQPVSMKVTHSDGTVVDRPPFPEMRPGDTLDVTSLDYRGTHARHAKRWSASTHLRCVFGEGEPTCVSHVALRSSLLIFAGNPGTLVGGTGVFEGASGRVVASREVAGGSDVVLRIVRRQQ
jgi:hypothetical protein